MTCTTPGCPNPRLPKRRVCRDCDRLRQRNQERERCGTQARKWPACEKCYHYRECKDGRLWVNGPLPCEELLDWEVGAQFDTGELSLRVWPAMVAL